MRSLFIEFLCQPLYQLGLCQAVTPCLRNAFYTIIGSRQLPIDRPGGISIIPQIHR